MNFLTLKECSIKYPCIPLGGLKHLLYSNKDFAEKCIRKVGYKLLVSEIDYLNWINNSKNTFVRHKRLKSDLSDLDSFIDYHGVKWVRA